MKTVRDYLRGHVLSREEVDTFLDGSRPNWARFDPELGYTLRSSFVRDGMDGCHTIATYADTGERRTMNYRERPCRVNAYGNSYTQCHQASDAETWEEYLAGHLGEPIRNFGVGGYGVYQAYRRMVRVESGDSGADHVIFNVFGVDDHLRSLDAWRRPRCGDWFVTNPPTMFHANPWDHVRIDVDTGELVERPNLCPTPESLYNLCDEEFVLERFSDDPAINLWVGQWPEYEVDAALLERLAEAIGVPVDLRDTEARPAETARLHLACGLYATRRILDWVFAFAARRGKKVLVLLTYGDWSIQQACEGRPRFDADLFDYLRARGARLVDMLARHVEDFASFRLSPRDYMLRYCIPHYNPAGNHFMAYAIKDAVVDWLEPRPVTYRDRGNAMGFDDYLPASPNGPA